MTNEEALNRFKWKYSLTKDYNDPHWEGGERREHSEWVEQLEIAIKALEKQIPKRLDVREEGRSVKIYRCFTCGKHIAASICNDIVVGDKQNYCDGCGQALDFNSSGSDTE